MGVLLQGFLLSILSISAQIQWMPQHFQSCKTDNHLLNERISPTNDSLLAFSQEYYVIREYLAPGWLVTVQACLTVGFILTFTALGILALELMRLPLKIVLQYEWIMTKTSYICLAVASKYFRNVCRLHKCHKNDYFFYL